VDCYCPNSWPHRTKRCINFAIQRQIIACQKTGKALRFGWVQASLAGFDNQVSGDFAGHPGLQAMTRSQMRLRNVTLAYPLRVRAMTHHFDAIDFLSIAGTIAVGLVLLTFGPLP
jgi:hypothetical protein